MVAVCLAQASLALRTTSPLITRRDGLRAALAAASAGAALPVAADPTYKSTVTLADGSIFPLASFGLQLYDDATAQRLASLALDAGFRNFFASVLANNQRGFAEAVQRSTVPRSDCFICGSVVSNRAQDEETAYTLTKLGCAENTEAFAYAATRAQPLDWMRLQAELSLLLTRPRLSPARDSQDGRHRRARHDHARLPMPR